MKGRGKELRLQNIQETPLSLSPKDRTKLFELSEQIVQLTQLKRGSFLHLLRGSRPRIIAYQRTFKESLDSFPDLIVVIRSRSSDHEPLD